MPVFWVLVGNVADLSQCVTSAYKLVVFLIRCPIFVRRMRNFFFETRKDWTAWYTKTQKWFDNIFSADPDCIYL